MNKVSVVAGICSFVVTSLEIKPLRIQAVRVRAASERARRRDCAVACQSLPARYCGRPKNRSGPQLSLLADSAVP